MMSVSVKSEQLYFGKRSSSSSSSSSSSLEIWKYNFILEWTGPGRVPAVHQGLANSVVAWCTVEGTLYHAVLLQWHQQESE